MLIRPYGERPDDGAVQLSFTLPTASARAGRAAAERLCRKMGLHDVRVSHAEDIGAGLTFCVVHARTTAAVDSADLGDLAADAAPWTLDEVNRQIQERIGRPLVVLGANAGADAHTIGLDAILNAKGLAGVPGLEAYDAFEVHNLGSQVAPETLVEAVRALKADALLVSQVVTHNDIHLRTLAELVERLDAEGLREQLILIAGGPRLGSEVASALRLDAGFGPDTTPADVADRLARLAIQKRGFNQ